MTDQDHLDAEYLVPNVEKYNRWKALRDEDGDDDDYWRLHDHIMLISAIAEEAGWPGHVSQDGLPLVQWLSRELLGWEGDKAELLGRVKALRDKDGDEL